MKVGVTLLFISAGFVMAVAYPVEKKTFDDYATEEAARRGSCMTTAFFCMVVYGSVSRGVGVLVCN